MGRLWRRLPLSCQTCLQVLRSLVCALASPVSLCPGSDDILASQSAAAARRQSLLDSKLTPLRAHSALVATRRSLLPPPSPAKKTDLDAASQRRESLTSKKLEPIKKHLELVDERRRRSAASRQDSTATLELDGLETASSNKTR